MQRSRFVTCLLLLLMTSNLRAETPAELPAPKHSQPFALVELFTSEGCSSCPPADRVLRELKGAAEVDGLRVFTLSYHVDYWDRLGWKDPFSDAVHTYRQNLYAKAFRSSRIYTPQMIVNGQTGFVGSDKPKAEKVIDETLEQTPDHGIAFLVEPGEAEGERVIRYRLNTVPDDNAVIVAVVAEDGLSNEVAAGENNGRTLEHGSVARALVYQRVQEARGDLTLTLPDYLDTDRACVVVFLQDVASMHVLAAERQHLVNTGDGDPETD